MKKVIGSLLLLSFWLFTGCAHVISKDLRAKADPSLTLTQVRQDPEAYQGKMVLWGGEIVETFNRRDGSTQIEVFQKPLDWRGEPKGVLKSEGRFLVLTDQSLDPYLFRSGRRITVVGEILGGRIKPLGEMDYRYPLLASKQLHLWPEDVYAYEPYPPYYYGLGWYDGPRWYWGFGFHYHRRRP